MYSFKEILELFAPDSKLKPFSFSFDGQKADLSTITAKRESLTEEQYHLIYDVVPGEVRVILEVRQFRDFPVIEYTPYLENYGTKPSPVISDFHALDIESEDPLTYGNQKLKEVELFVGGRISVRYNLGSNAAPTDFLPQKRDIFSRVGCNKLELECHGAWCSTDYLPFFGIDTDQMNGINLGIGWNGAWRFCVEKEVGKYALGGGRKSRIHCGMKRAQFRILPGERLMQPGVLLHFRENKNIRDGQNEFRRFMLAHNAPRDSKGNLQKPPMCFCTWGGLASCKQKERLELIRKKQLPYENLWIDAGWMGKDGECPHFLEDSPVKSDWYSRVGSWEINRFVHPEGLRPVSDAAHEANMRTLVWFETTRIAPRSGSNLLTEHPEWLLGNVEAVRNGTGSDLLLNIGIPEARDYLTGIVVDIMKKENIDDYREDFNIDAWNFWCSGDTPDRIGVTEMKYVENFYKFWADIRKHFPDSFIDNCSGGGRRLDYKSAMLSFPMCQSDFACYSEYEEECITLENMYLDDWLPLHGTLNWGENDPYHAACALGGGYGSKIWQFNGREVAADHDYDMHRKLLQWGKLLRDMHLMGDVYPLIDSPELDMTKWNALQTHLPEKDAGAVQIFRRKQSLSSVQKLTLAGIVPEASYTVNTFSGKSLTMSGKELMNFTVELAQPRSFEIIHYFRQM